MQTPPASIPIPTQDPEPPTNLELVYGEAIDHITRVQGWDADRFERYVHEWAYNLQTMGEYGKVVWAPGAGDKGRDVRAYVTDETGDWDNFQCKFYKAPLMPSDVWLELAKLCYYTFENVFTVPRKYYFVAPKDVGPEFSNLIGNSETIRKRLIEAWTKDRSAIPKKLTPLDGPLKKHVDDFDFGIVTFKPQREIIEALRGTEYFKRVFGCTGLKRPKLAPIPQTPTHEETHYVQSLKEAFADNLCVDASKVTEEHLKQHTHLSQFMHHSRTCFYSAEQLYRFGRDTFPTAHSFEFLQNQVYAGVIAVALGNHEDGFACVCAVTTVAGQLQLGNHFLVGMNLVTVEDRQGMCHQIVNSNDGRLSWVNKGSDS